MDCSCTITCETDSGPEFSAESSPVARKVHICCECHRKIMPRETYSRVSGLWDGKFEAYKTCLDCLSIRRTFFSDYYVGGLWDELTEYIWDGEVHESCLASLTPAARARVCEVIEEGWDEL